MSNFERGKGQGFSLSSVQTLVSTAAGPFANGYVSQGRGILRSGQIIFSGMPVAGAAVVMVLRDGPTGNVILRIPMYGLESVSVVIDPPVDLANGLYVTGLAATAGEQRVYGTFVHEVNEPGPQPQAQPR